MFGRLEIALEQEGRAGCSRRSADLSSFYDSRTSFTQRRYDGKWLRVERDHRFSDVVAIGRTYGGKECVPRARVMFTGGRCPFLSCCCFCLDFFFFNDGFPWHSTVSVEQEPVVKIVE